MMSFPDGGVQYPEFRTPDAAPYTGWSKTMEREGDAFSVMCIDDNVLLVDALERRLALEPGLTGFYRVDDLADCIVEARRLRPTVVLLDIDLPSGIDAMTILASIVHDVPESKVIVFTGYPSGELVRRTMSSGAWGFISKGTSADRLIESIRRVVTGEAVIELED